MAPPRTGTVEPHGDHFDARVRNADGKRARRICLPASFTREQAKERANALQRVADEEHAAARAAARTAAPSPARAGSVDAWALRWFMDREARGLTSVGDDRSRWNTWVSPAFGARDIAQIQKGDLEDFVEQLDRAVAENVVRWKTALNVWTVVSKAFADASNAKTRSLRVRQDNPAADVRGPDRGAVLALQYLSPAELLRFVASEKVPLVFRRAVVLAVYLLVRAAELVALRWDAVDLAAGVVTVHTAQKKKRATLKTTAPDATKSTKTKRARRVPIEPPIRPLLETMRRESGGVGPVVPIGAGLHLARGLRKYLKRAGILRPELHTSDATRRAVRFHDLRATGVTWHAIRGLDPLKIMARSGHEDFKSMRGYMREAEILAAGGTFGEVFPDLPLHALGVRQDAADRAGGAIAYPGAAVAVERQEEAPEGPDLAGPDEQPDRPDDWPKTRAIRLRTEREAERETGFEPARKRTFSHTSRDQADTSAGAEHATRTNAHATQAPEAARVTEAARTNVASQLAGAVATLLASGDVEGAKKLADVLASMLAAPPAEQTSARSDPREHGAPVVDLAAERARRVR